MLTFSIGRSVGTGTGGSISVTTPGALVLDGNGNSNTQIAASATGSQSGPGGDVTIRAGSLTIEGGAEIASSTAGPGHGGDGNVAVASDIVLSDHGPQITSRSTGSGDAGSIIVSAARLLMNNGAAISTEAVASTANGGNMTLFIRDFLYLVGSEITASVKGETGNGGNIEIDPYLAILNHSRVIAQAVEGHGGNVTINADELIASTDSIFSATGQLGVFNGLRLNVNGALVELSSELRNAVALARDSCISRSIRPRSSLMEAGRGGVIQDPDAVLPGFYLAGHDIGDVPATSALGKEDLLDASTVSPSTFAACR